MLFPAPAGALRVGKEGGIGHPRLKVGKLRLRRGNGRLHLGETFQDLALLPLALFLLFPLALAVLLGKREL